MLTPPAWLLLAKGKVPSSATFRPKLMLDQAANASPLGGGLGFLKLAYFQPARSTPPLGGTLLAPRPPVGDDQTRSEAMKPMKLGCGQDQLVATLDVKGPPP